MGGVETLPQLLHSAITLVSLRIFRWPYECACVHFVIVAFCLINILYFVTILFFYNESHRKVQIHCVC